MPITQILAKSRKTGDEHWKPRMLHDKLIESGLVAFLSAVSVQKR